MIEPVKIAPIPSIEFVDRSHTLESKSTARRATLIWLIVSQLLALASLFFLAVCCWHFGDGI